MHALLYRLTLRNDAADDLLQDLVVRLASSDVFATADSTYAFARASAMRLAIDWRRKQKRTAAEQEPNDFDLFVHDDPAPPAVASQREQWKRALEAMTELAEADQLLITMRYLDSADYEAIALERACTPHQARGLVHKALSRLRDRLGAARHPSEAKHG